jgi:hypothetical protein
MPMSGLLFGIGAFAVVVGAVMIGFGIPVNEFSFGNTLILAGSTVAVGGLIVIGLGVVVAQLQRIADALATRAPIRSGRPPDMFESGARSAPGQVPFPPKPKFDAGIRELHSDEPRSGLPVPVDMPLAKGPSHSFAPTLRNPDESPVTVEDDVSLSPQHPLSVPGPANHAEPLRSAPSFEFDGSEVAEKRQEVRQEIRQEPTFEDAWRPTPPAPAPKPHTAYFDAMWPAEPKPAKSPSDTDIKPYEPKFDPAPREAISTPPRHAEMEAPKPRQSNEPRTVAILKSGVVDGMGYTLYVDGSIEAELPQGTLRFASINELRGHLEKNA